MESNSASQSQTLTDLYGKAIKDAYRTAAFDMEQLSDLLKHNPRNSEEHFMLGTARMALAGAEVKKAGILISAEAISSYEAAIRHFEQATNSDPLHFRAAYNLGLCRLELGKLQEDQDRALSAKDQELSLRRSRVEFVESRKAFLLALDILKNPKADLGTMSPQQLTAKCNKALGVLSLETGRFDEAIELLDAALSLDPRAEKAQYYKGLALHNQYRYAEAIQCFAAEQKSDAGDYLAWNDCGNSHFNQGDLEQAKFCYLEAIKICDRQGQQVGFVCSNIAWCLLTREHPDDFEAEKYLQKAFDSLGISVSGLDLPDYLKLNGMTLVAKRALIQASALEGLMHYIRGSLDQASKFLSYSVSVAKHYSIDEPYPYLYLGNVYFKTSRYDDAEKSYAQAEKFGPRYAEAFDSHGVALCKNDKPQDALAEFQAAVRLKPSLVSAVLHLTRTQAYLDSGGKTASETPRFIGYWTKSRQRGITALALIAIAAALATTTVTIGDHTSETKIVTSSPDSNLTSTRTITDSRSASVTSMILIGIIVFVLLFPDLRSVKPGAINIDLQGEKAGYCGRLDSDVDNRIAGNFLS